MISEARQKDVIYLSHIKAPLSVTLDDKTEPNWSPWFYSCSHKTLFTAARVYKSKPDQILLLLKILHWFSITLKTESILLAWSPMCDNWAQGPQRGLGKRPLPSYLVPSAFLCPSTLTFSHQHSKLVLSQSPSLIILRSRNVLSRSLPGYVLLFRSLVPSSCLRETISIHLTSSPLKEKILIKYA